MRRHGHGVSTSKGNNKDIHIHSSYYVSTCACDNVRVIATTITALFTVISVAVISIGVELRSSGGYMLVNKGTLSNTRRI